MPASVILSAMNSGLANKPIVPTEMFGTIPVQAGMTIADLERVFSDQEVIAPTATDRHKPGWVWDDLLLRRQMSLLVGDLKIDKTTFLTELIRHVSAGSSFLGRGVNPTTIGLVTEEAHGLWIKRHREKPLPSSLRIWSHEAAGEIHEFSLPKCIRMAGVTQPGLIIIDSIGRLLSPGAESNAAVMARCVDQVRQAADCAAVLFVHHPAKTRSRERNCRGSNLLPAAAHEVLELLPYSVDPADANRRLLRIRSQLPPSPTTLAYEWYPDDQLITAMDPPAKAVDFRAHEVIRMLLAKRPQGRGTVRDLLADWPLDAAQISRATLLRRLRLAFNCHELTRTGRGVNVDPFVYSVAPTSTLHRPSNDTPLVAHE